MNKKKRCTYNTNDNEGDGFLPIKECGKKAKYELDVSTANDYEDEFVMWVCNKHYEVVKDCSNISPEVRKI